MIQEEIVVCPFVVVTDSREQAKFHFRQIKSDADKGNKPLVIQTVRRGLATGDYSIDGCETEIAVERKSLGDLFHCCGSDRDRFQKQLDRLNELQFGAVVVEAGIGAILKGHPRSLLNPKTVYRSVIAWQQRLPGVHWWFCPTRRLAEVTTFRILERWWRDDRDGKRDGNRENEICKPKKI